MSGLPVRYLHQNILVGHDDSRAALFRVATVSYPFLADADKRAWLGRLARFAFAVEADFSLLGHHLRDRVVDPALQGLAVDVLALEPAPDHVRDLAGPREAARVGGTDRVACACHD